MTVSPRRPDCPAWCTADHTVNLAACTSDGHTLTPHGEFIGTWARRTGSLGDHLSAGARGRPLHLTGAGDVSALAALIDALAEATPEQHRELADAIRREAALLGWEVPGDRQ